MFELFKHWILHRPHKKTSATMTNWITSIMIVFACSKWTTNFAWIHDWDNKQQSQAQSDQCKIQMTFRLASWRCEFWELLGQSKLMQIHQRETQNHQGAITYEVCFLAAQFHKTFIIYIRTLLYWWVHILYELEKTQWLFLWLGVQKLLEVFIL